MEPFPPDDRQFEDVRITNVEPFKSGAWCIGLSTGWSFCVPAESPVVPAAGMAARLYGRGIGYTVRGLFLDGMKVFYRTEAEEEAERVRAAIEHEQAERYDFEKARPDLDRRVAALPEFFQQRIARFRRNNPEFRWKHEAYELFVIEQAVAIATAFEDLRGDPDALRANMNGFRELDWEAQKNSVPGLDDGHSGNTFGAALALAYHYLTRPQSVVEMHGALAPLVGSEEYGCVPKV